METKEHKMTWLKNSISLKIALIGFITLVMLIPTNLINDLMREREKRLNETYHEVTSKWGEDQKTGGLIMTVPCKYETKKDDKTFTHKKYLNILPDQLDIEGEVVPEIRYRGIFKVVVYRANLNFSGYFDSISLDNISTNGCEIQWDKAILTTGISDTRGINHNVEVKWNKQTLKSLPGTGDSPLLTNGIHSPVNIKPDIKNKFSFSLDINGSGLLSFLPLGKETNVRLNSNWAHPQFDGAYLPDQREVNESGFNATWKILQHNRNYPQQWFGKMDIKHSAFGVELIEPVNVYQKSQRSIKYALLFIILTFIVFFFSELIINKRAHAVQYIMVGAALCIFFSLLIALSEHMHFNLAYLIASTTIVSMVTLFSNSVFRNIKVTAIILLILTVLFVFLFVILQMADYSLILGNVGLVIILAMVMIVSRKIDWQNEKVIQ